MKLELYCDGGCYDNQNQVFRNGYGSFCIYNREGKEVVLSYSHIQFGNITNNEAEYLAMINGLSAIQHQLEGVEEIRIRTDSQLVVNQLTGKWSVNKPHLDFLCRRLSQMIKGFKQSGVDVFIKHVPREVLVEILGH